MSGVSSLFSSSIHSTFWHYFKYTIDESVSITSITVSLKEVSSTGYINVFLQRGSLPTLTEFLDADLDQSTSVHSVYSVYTSGSRDFYIGVYGSSFIPFSQSFSYKLGGLLFFFIILLLFVLFIFIHFHFIVTKTPAQFTAQKSHSIDPFFWLITSFD